MVIFLALILATVLGALNVLGALSVDLVYLAATIWGLSKLMLMAGRDHTLVISGALILGGALLIARLTLPDMRFTPYLIIVPAHLFIAYLFARGLRPGREPILLALIQMMDIQPVDNPKFIRFVRGQCLAWAVMCFVTAVLALGCIFWSVQIPSLKAAFGAIIAAQLIWFPFSHIYAALRYDRKERLWDTIRILSRPEARALIAP